VKRREREKEKTHVKENKQKKKKKKRKKERKRKERKGGEGWLVVREGKNAVWGAEGAEGGSNSDGTTH